MAKETNTSWYKAALAKTQRFISSPFSGPASDTAPVQPPNDPAVQEPSTPILRQELGISQEAYWTRFELYQYNPDELITKKGYRILEKMATSDDTISMGLNALKMMRISSGYEIVAASEDPMDVQIADEVADNFDNMRGSLQEKLFSIMGVLDIGWSLHEKIFDFWGTNEAGDIDPNYKGPYKGHVRLSGLKAKNPQWFNPAVDDFNNITGIVMISPPHYAGKLPHQKFLTYSAQKRYENVGGTSRIRTLYDWWYLKGIAKAALGILLKKYGKDTPIMYYPPTMNPADKQAGLNTLANLATSAAISMPEGTRLEFAKMDFNTVNGCLAVVEKADQQMTKILLGQVMSSGTSSGQSHKGGSQQGGGTGGGSGKGGGGLQEKTLDMYLEFIGSDVANNPMAELIKDIVDANYQGVIKYPTFKFKSLDEADMTASVSAWTDAVQKGAVTSTADDEQHIREILGFPSVNGKTTLRPVRFKNNATPKPPIAHAPIIPATLPIAGYRPPTPSAPGLPANYAENFGGEGSGILGHTTPKDIKSRIDKIKHDFKSGNPHIIHSPEEDLKDEDMRGFRTRQMEGESVPADISAKVELEHLQKEIYGKTGPQSQEALDNYNAVVKTKSELFNTPDETLKHFNSPITKSSFDVGNKVDHPTYGTGKITVKDGNKITVDFPGHGLKDLNTKYNPVSPSKLSEHNHAIALFSEGFKPFRALTPFEKHTDFAESLAIMEKEGADVIAKDAAAVLHKAVNKIKVDCKKIMGDSTAIRKLTLPYRGELAGVIRDGLQEVAAKSMKQAKAEIKANKGAAKFAESSLISLAYNEMDAARKNLKAHLAAGKMTQAQVDKEWAHHVKDYKETVKENAGKVDTKDIQFAEAGKAHLDYGHMEPKEVMQLLEDKAFSMAGDISDDVLKKIKQIMYDGVKSGASYKDMVYNIENQIAPYLDLTDTTGDLSGARLMTIVRTNVAGAYNDARDSIFLDPSLDGFVLAFQFSAILDEQTTGWCSNMDGRIFKVTNPIWDIWDCPTFYNCRSVKIPITQADDWDGVESDEPTEKPPEW